MTPLREILEGTYFPLNHRIRDEKTRSQYRFALRNLRDAIGSEPRVSDLTDDNVSRLMSLLLARSLAAKTVNERRGRINCLWSWLARRGVVSTWPTVARIPEPVRIPVAWSREDLDRLFRAADTERLLISGVPSPSWWRTLHLVAWDTGERITALLGCRWDHLSGEWLAIPAELRKAKRRDMAYRLAPETVRELDAVRSPTRDLIWPWPLNWSYLWTRYRLIRQRAGLPTDRWSAFHRIRRSVASHYEAAGGNATELLGHESRATTRAYLDPRITGTPQAVDLLFRPG